MADSTFEVFRENRATGIFFAIIGVICIQTAGPDAVADRMLSTPRPSAARAGSSAPSSLFQTTSPEKA